MRSVMADGPGSAMADELARASSLLAEVLGLPAAAIPRDASIDSFEAWDSLGHMRLILALEELLGATLPPEAIVEIANLQDVADLLDPA